MSITIEAKQRVLELYETGMTSRQIVEALGYDYKILGGQRMKNIVRNTRKEADSSRGLHEGYRRTSAARMDNEEIEQLDNSAVSYARLKNEVIYLREEVKETPHNRSFLSINGIHNSKSPFEPVFAL